MGSLVVMFGLEHGIITERLTWPKNRDAAD